MDRFEEKFRKALEFLESSDIGSPNKPVIPHVKRVGELLYKKGFDIICYSGDIWTYQTALTQGIGDLRNACK